MTTFSNNAWFFAQWLNLADQHVGIIIMFFTDCKFNCLSGNFETILLYPQPSSRRIWILILSLANILPIINCVKIQTINFIHKINKMYLQNDRHFAYGTLRLLDSSPTVWSFRLLDTSPTDHFAYETFRPLDISPIRQFAYYLDRSPTDCSSFYQQDYRYQSKIKSDV